MPRPYPFSTDVDGRRYTGDWTLQQGGMICIRSAWGSKIEPLGRKQPEARAKELLQQIVREGEQRRRDELLRQDREAAKLRRR